MVNLLTVIVVGVLTFIVVDIMWNSLQNKIENDNLKEEEIKKLRRRIKFYEDDVKEREDSMRIFHIEHNNEVNAYRRRIRDLQDKLDYIQNNSIDNQIKMVKAQLEQKSDIIDGFNKEYRELLDKLRRLENQR